MIMRDLSDIYTVQLPSIVSFPTLAEHESSADQELKNQYTVAPLNTNHHCQATG